MWNWWLRASACVHTTQALAGPPRSPCSGCCYRSAVSGGSCSACSSASSPCGNRRSWGPSGCRGNGPAEACSETSSQMDWRVGRPRNRVTRHHLSREQQQIKHPRAKQMTAGDRKRRVAPQNTNTHTNKQDEIITIKGPQLGMHRFYRLVSTG